LYDLFQPIKGFLHIPSLRRISTLHSVCHVIQDVGRSIIELPLSELDSSRQLEAA
jgi:hypothetical protein